MSMSRAHSAEALFQDILMREILQLFCVIDEIDISEMVQAAGRKLLQGMIRRIHNEYSTIIYKEQIKFQLIKYFISITIFSNIQAVIQKHDNSEINIYECIS